jgi:hypothetical protein
VNLSDIRSKPQPHCPDSAHEAEVIHGYKIQVSISSSLPILLEQIPRALNRLYIYMIHAIDLCREKMVEGR